MPDHDMSESACIARATRQKEHDQLIKDVADLKMNSDLTTMALRLLNTRLDKQREMIKTLFKITKTVAEEFYKGEKDA